MAVRKVDLGCEFCVTVIYAHNCQAARMPLWEKLHQLSVTMTKPWVVGGDFNNLLYANECLGGQVVQPSELQAFHDCVLSHSHNRQLQDLRSKGAFYTWNNCQRPTHRICSRLDRTLVNAAWLHAFPKSETWCLQESLSDHCPLLLTLSR